MAINSFAINWWALLATAIAAILLWLWLRTLNTLPSPRLFASSLSFLADTPVSLRQRLAKLPRWLYVASFCLLSLAFIDPHLYLDKPPSPKGNRPTPQSVEGIAIYLALDQSGSMAETIRNSSQSKMDLLKKVTADFVAGNTQKNLPGRPNDLIGLLAFARGVDLLSPLTLDHQTILDQLNALDVVGDRNRDGTAIGYAIFKAANLLTASRRFAQDSSGKGKAAYEIKSSVIVLVTDGMQDPNPLDKETPWRQIDPLEAARYAKENNVRLYIVNVEPKLAAKSFDANRRQMTKAAEMTGGKFFIIDGSNDLAEIYASIDKLEKGALPVSIALKDELQQLLNKDQLPMLYQRVSLFPYLIALGLLALALALLLETSWLWRYP